MAVIKVKDHSEIEFGVANELVKINGDDPVPRASFFSAMLNDNVLVTSEIVDEQGAVQTQIDQTALGMPPVLLVPFQKFAGGKNGTLIDETHLKATIVSGVVTVEGVPPSAGNWVMQEKRMNQSLKSIGAPFYIKSGDLNIVILNEMRPQ